MDVPFGDNPVVKRLGARWDREARLWYDPTPDGRLSKLWGPPKGQHIERKPSLMSDVPSKRKYLNVAYAERAQAKRFGARWCPTMKSWYIPSGLHPKDVEELTARFQRCRAPRRMLQRLLEAPAAPARANPKTHSPIPLSASDTVREHDGWGFSALGRDARSSWKPADEGSVDRHGRLRVPAWSTSDKSKHHHYAHSSASTHSGAISVDEGGPPVKPERPTQIKATAGRRGSQAQSHSST